MIRARDSIVFTAGLQNQHNKFKRDLNNLITREIVNLKHFLTLIWTYTRSKYELEIEKIKRYASKIETGEDAFLRSFFTDIQTPRKEEIPATSHSRVRSFKKAVRNSNSKSK